jgi:UDP-glucose 4-epimerase
MEDKRVIVTGGAGFIGSNLAGRLAEENDVIIVDDFSTGRRENIKELIRKKNVTLAEGSVTHLELLQKTFLGADYVFHQAALPSVPRSVKNPAATNEVNVGGTLNVLIAARDCKVAKVVYASSSSVYGDTEVLPKSESMKPRPLSPYAVSKLAGEYYCKVFHGVYGLPTTALRYFNVYGPKQDPSSEYAAVIPRFISRIRKDAPLRIYGDGKQTRDFTFVDDVVEANIRAADSGRSDGKVLNIAGGRRITINELAEKIAELSGKHLISEHADMRPGDVRHSLADISAAQELIGWKPKMQLSAGLKKTIGYFTGGE